MPDRNLPTEPAQLIAVVVDRLTRLQTDVTDMRSDLRSLPTAQELATLRARVDALEAWQTWALRIIVAAVITAVLALVVTAGGNAK